MKKVYFNAIVATWSWSKEKRDAKYYLVTTQKNKETKIKCHVVAVGAVETCGLGTAPRDEGDGISWSIICLDTLKEKKVRIEMIKSDSPKIYIEVLLADYFWLCLTALRMNLGRV